MIRTLFSRMLPLCATASLLVGCMPAQHSGTVKNGKSQNEQAEGPGAGGGANVTASSATANTELRLTLGTRWMVSSTLSDIFGANTIVSGTLKVSDVLKAFVLDQPASFGGSCDPYANSHPMPVLDSHGNVNRVIETPSARGCTDSPSSQAAILPSSSTSRLAWNTRTCDRILASDAAVRYAATQAGLPASAALDVPNEAQIRASYDLFYPGIEIPSAALRDLQTVTTTAAGLGAGAGEGWRFLLLTLCLSPGWQVL